MGETARIPAVDAAGAPVGETARIPAVDAAGTPVGETSRMPPVDPGVPVADPAGPAPAVEVPVDAYPVPWQLRRAYTVERLLIHDDEYSLYLARTRSEQPVPVALRVYRQGRWPDAALLERVAASGSGPHLAGLLDHGRSGIGDGASGWLVQEHLPLGTLGSLMAGEPWVEARVLEVVAAVARCAQEWRLATGRELLDFRPDDLLIRGLDPMVLAVGHLTTPLTRERARPAPPETVQGERGAPGGWWALGVVVHELLTGRPPRFEPGDAACEIDDAVTGRWRPLVDGLLATDPETRWGQKEVAVWSAGGTPPPAARHEHRPIEFAGRPHPTPAALAERLTARPASAEAWLGDGGGNVLLRDWLDLDVEDTTFDRGLLDEPPPVIATAFAAGFTRGARPRYRGFAIDAEGLAELAAGGPPGHLVLAEVVQAGVLGHAARHRCVHVECQDTEPRTCRLVARVDEEAPLVLAEVRQVLDRMREVTGEVSGREWNRGVAVAVELTLDPRAMRRYRRRLRLEGLRAPGRGGPALVGWWREQRRNALSGRGDEIGTRAAVAAVLLMTASAAATGQQIAEERRAELRRRRDEAASKGLAVLIRIREAVFLVIAQLRLRGPSLVREFLLTLADQLDKLGAQARQEWAKLRARTSASASATSTGRPPSVPPPSGPAARP
ncbi:hypothetical protein [Sphaerisporangium fuscum]|uniref:hypothetical protein n=1 Tax=Sphaerisporangium fuscum TaxID=2835868 RepID=UPI001BDC92BD|nr:hypothetical protein [Sphaerisporangium fuscum]